MSTGFFNLAPLVVLFPGIGLLFNMVFGGRLPEKVVGWVASLAVGAAFVISILLAVSLSAIHGHAEIVSVTEWMSIGSLHLDWAFRVDTLSVAMMLMVSGVGTLIHIYAIGYMHEDVRFKGDPTRFQRFFVFMNLFIAMMMILVSGDNYLMLFVGWEGVGLCSFLLIGFWYDLDILGRPSLENAKAANKAFIANRIGDFGFLIASFLIFTYLGSLQFDLVFAEVEHVAQPVILTITLFMLLGVVGKSAQIPLFVWLPDAMAGPTPVSALIHAATMVTAGVYLVARSAPLYGTVPAAQEIVALIGAVTALFAATIAVAQYDIKRVLAYSTISQLGFMVAAVGMGAYAAGMFHLVMHAFFKALLFLSAGSVILGIERGYHAMSHGKKGHGFHHTDDEVFNPNDMRNMGGLKDRMPVTFWVYLAGTLALAGIPPFAGFWSKDEILLDASLHYPVVYWLLTAAAFMTAFYMGRQVWLVFFGKSRHEAAEKAEESPRIITAPLVILAGLSVLGGVLNLPHFHTLGHWLEYTLGELRISEFSWLMAGQATLIALFAIFLAWLLYGRREQAANEPDALKKLLGPAFVVFEHMYWIDEGYAAVFINRYKDLARFLAEVIDGRFWHDWLHDSVLAAGFGKLARFLADPVDLGLIDGIANGLADLTQWVASRLRRFQNGFVRSYALSVLLGVVLILGYLLFR
ncbi:MAG: NADH-quinone oxidoreductase subunit L [Anaerolineales bacterium]|nr:NADH-quinone oxidoreductase subunit L [Anaerolineales bacterium]